MDVIKKDMMEGTAILLITRGSGSANIMSFLRSCLSLSALVIKRTLRSIVSPATVASDTDCTIKKQLVNGI